MRLHRILFLACSTYVILSLFGCTSEILYEEASDVLSTSYALMTLQFEETNCHALTITVENQSTMQLEYDKSIQLNIEYDDIWYNVPCVKESFEEIRYGILPGAENSYKLTLDDWFGSLDSGHYRIIKPIFGPSTQEFMVAEFTIE